MAPLRSLLALSLLLASANAHFHLLAPPSLEGDKMDENQQPNGPCGGGVPDLSKDVTTDFHVDGDAVGLMLLHPQANWLIRGTLDENAAGNWTQLAPIVMQSNRGSFCEPAVAVPKEWAGKKGIIGIVCNAPDGLLYQCAAVNFVSGASTTHDSSTCNNGSITISLVPDDATLTGLLGDGTPTNSSGSSDSTPNAAPSVVGSGLPIGSFAVTAVMLLVGAALL